LGKIAILPAVKTGTIAQSQSAAERPAALASRPIASGDGWSVSEFTCTLGPGNRPFEEWHERVAISAVIAGSFRYRTTAGAALLHPGAFLLGSAATCYECGHDHTGGDRCIAFHYDPDFFQEIAATAAASSRYCFPVAMLPALRELGALVVELEATLKLASPVALDELAIRLAERVLGAAAGVDAAPVRVAARDQQRVGNAIRHIERNAGQPLDLAALAGTAFMSKYHFLRTFRKVVGVTPHQFVLGVRLRRAALELRTTAAPIAAVALQAGFGDLSTFSSHFRAAFGTNPRTFRAQQHRARAG
jgi:AraC family transcriptional regulator